MSKIQVGNIFISKTAEKELKKLPPEIKKRFKKQIAIFKENPYYPSLQFKQFKVKKPNLYEIRINDKYRAILEMEIDEKENRITSNFTIIAIGKHDILDNWK